MGFFGNLFGRKKAAAKPSSTPPSQSTPVPSAQKEVPGKPEEPIRLFDKFGREILISRQEWREKVLPKNLQDAWNQPDELYGMIVAALQDGFKAEVVGAAQQLYQIDQDKARGTCIWGIVLMEAHRLDEAEKVFRDHFQKYGEEGYLLTNLAKVYARRNDPARAEETLWHGLELDPNQDNGVVWYELLIRERDGEAAGQEALRRIAALPGSWRAQLWLGRSALQSRHLEQALTWYRESLAQSPKPVPGDLLMQISGDLGNQGYIPELLQTTEPHFSASLHGLQVGNNLIKAHLDLGQIDAARQILDQLFALKRPDWRDTLSFWDTEIAKTRLSTTTTPEPSQMKMGMFTIQGPIWLRETSPATELFPLKPQDGPVICFLGSTATVASNSQKVEHQLSDHIGRMARSLPLFLAEQTFFGTSAKVRTLVPWVAAESRAFLLSGKAWSDDDASGYARHGDLPSDYMVTTHLQAQAEPWIAEMRLIRTIDSQCLASTEVSFPVQKPEGALSQLAHQLIDLLVKQGDASPFASAPAYQVPGATEFPWYLLRLEQLLAVQSAGMEGFSPGFLNGERDIIDGNLQLCLACPTSLTTRLVLAETLRAMKKVRADILPEFQEKLAALQSSQPLPGSTQGVIQRLIDEALAP